ncbi:FmdB family zinc ribbon protein [Amycolatopsis sp. NPDC004368]
MPTYQYACKECDHRFEAVQSFSDPSLTVCPQCSGPLRKVYGSVGVVFKGSGFYRTDSRDSSKSSTTAATPAKTESKSETKTETKSESKTNSSSSSSTTTKTASTAS